MGSKRRAVGLVCLLLLGALAACEGTADRTSKAAAPDSAAAPTPPVEDSSAVTFTLAVGERASHPIRFGEVHEYRIHLAAEQYLSATITQNDIDLFVELLDPVGRTLLRIDSLTGTRGVEEVFWAVITSGVHRLRLRAQRGDVNEGHYALDSELSPRASDLDKKRARACQLIAKGQTVRRDEKNPRRALLYYKNALRLWEDLQDRRQQARAQWLIGFALVRLDEHRQAVEYYRRALDLLSGDGASDRDAEWRVYVLHLLAQAYGDLGHFERAKTTGEEALRLRRQLRDLRGETRTAINLGIAYVHLGEPQNALTIYGRALELAEELGSLEHQAQALHNRGRCYLTLGHAELAFDDFERALELRRSLGDAGTQASTLTALGQTHQALNGDTELVKAVAYFKRALELQRQGSNPRGQAIALMSLGVVHVRLGENTEARAAFEEAIAILEDIDAPLDEAEVLVNLGRITLEDGDALEALDIFQKAYGIFELHRDVPNKIQTLRWLALAEHQGGNTRRALGHLRDALGLIEGIRTKPLGEDLRLSYFATKQEFFDLSIRLLMELHFRYPTAGYDREALSISERARARSLLDNLAESERRDLVDPDLRDRERELDESIRSRAARLFDEDAAAGEESALGRELRELGRAYQDVLGTIRGDAAFGAPVDPARIQAEVLDRDTLLLEYELGEEKSFLWAVTPDAVHSFELPARHRIEEAAQRAYRLLAAGHHREGWKAIRVVLADLGEMLLAPVVHLLAEKRLLVVSEGALLYLPFGPLRPPGSEDPTRSLLADHEIVHVPSASSLALLRRRLRGRPGAPDLIAVVADPVFQAHDPRLGQGGGAAAEARASAASRQFERLVHSRHEAESILRLAPSETSLEAMGFDANRDVITGGVLGRYRYLHFATHGIFDAEHPQLSGLVLSQLDAGGEPRDGFLYAHEVYNLELRADLVVLSACQTALGKEVRGEGLVGLTQGFMYAGARRVIVSLWQVNDRATAALMQRFYGHLLESGLRPAAALRAAQLEIAREPTWHAPYYWAGFVLQGEW